MEDIGKVKDYNNYYGTIVTESGETYLLLDEEISNNNKIKKADLVSFVPETYEKKDIKENVARFVKKIDINKNRK